MFRYILWTISFLVAVTSLFSANISFTPSDFNNNFFQYTCIDFLGTIVYDNPAPFSSGESFCNTAPNDFALIGNQGDFRIDLASSLDNLNYNKSQTHYNQGTDFPAGTTSCSVQIPQFNENTFSATIEANLNQFTPKYTDLNREFQSIMDRNYHMKTFVYLKATDMRNSSNVRYFLPDTLYSNYTYNSTEFNTGIGTTATTLGGLGEWSSIQSRLSISPGSYPYVLAKPTLEQVNFSNAKIELNRFCELEGIFCANKYEVVTKPIDGKCDLDPNGLISDAESQTKNKITTPAEKTIQINFDSTMGDVEMYDSISSQYLSLFLNNGVTFISRNLPFFERETINLKITAKPGNSIKTLPSECSQFRDFDRRHTKICKFRVTSGAVLNFDFVERDADGDGVPYHLDECKEISGKPELMGCSTIDQLETRSLVYYEDIGDSAGFEYPFFNKVSFELEDLFFSYEKILFFQDKYLINNGNFTSEAYTNLNPFGKSYKEISGWTFFPVKPAKLYSGDYIGVDSNYEFVGSIKLSAKINYGNSSFFDQYRNLEIRKKNNMTYLVPYDEPVKFGDSIIVETQTDSIYFDNNEGVLEELQIPAFSLPIEVTKQYSDEIKEITSSDIAFSLSEIGLFETKDEAQEKILSTIETMSSLNISQNILTSTIEDYDSGEEKVTSSKVIINISNIPEGSRDLSVYYIIPKGVTQYYDDITFPTGSSARAQKFVTDKDPIIGWYFEEPESEEVIVIEVPEDTEGGSVIITEEPALYNGGDLVVRYREVSCASDEQLLFELDALSYSSVYEPGADKNFKVCLAHLNQNLSLGGYNSHSIFNITAGQNATLEQTGMYTVTAQENTGKYWSTLIQQSNPGTYSCLGSFEQVDETTLFGDCNFNPSNRLWINLDVDSIGPTIDVTYPSLGNAVQAQIEVTDIGSGVDWSSVRYCIDTANTCTPSTSYSQGENLFISCGGVYGCVKYVKVQASDISGNANTFTKQLRLLDIGSSCQSDCTAKPSPNRYLAECSGLNGCFYHQYDINGLFDNGEYVANQCDFNIIGAWVSYNTTHDIQCPRGPFRLSRYTEEFVEVEDVGCRSLRTTEYPILLNGENIIMNVITCIN